MTKTKSTKRALLMSALSLLMCVSMLIGSTFAWFTDSVTSAGNKIQSGTLKLDLELLDKEEGWASVKESKAAIFDYALWEPGYTDVKILKVENEGNLALKWVAKFVSANELTELAKVIDVYVKPSATELTYPADRNLDGYTKAGTVADFVNTIESTTYGDLDAGKSAYLGIALKMQESAGNEYKGMSLGGSFDIQILATQRTYESDSFDNQYDVNAPLNFAPVSNANELRIAIANKEENIVLTGNVVVDDTFTLDYDANINGGGYTIYRTDGTALMTSAAGETTIHTGVVFNVKAGTTLTLKDIIVDGGAVWSGEVNATLGRGTVNTGVTATGALIATEGNANIILGEGVVIQNNCGANAISLATRGGGSLTLNGAHIINNTSAAGAIWGGDDITINEGTKINNNHATSIGGAIRMVNGNNAITVTMNGGEINNNYSNGNGGAIWGGNNAKYYFNGGEMAYNAAAGAGGAVWTGTYESYTIAGDFKLHNNSCGENIGGAIRFCDHASLTMTGGSVYNNTANGKNNAFYLNNNSATINGGSIADNFSYAGGLGLTVGEADINCVISFSLSTNHNTAYLAAEFNSFEFTVNSEASNFDKFNFKPAADYVYAQGDEAKLICKNEGYSTYWDDTTNTFRLIAN